MHEPDGKEKEINKRKHLIIQEDGNLTRKDCCTPLCRGHNT
jgi:hypothetical protein